MIAYLPSGKHGVIHTALITEKRGEIRVRVAVEPHTHPHQAEHCVDVIISLKQSESGTTVNTDFIAVKRSEVSVKEGSSQTYPLKEVNDD